MNWSPNQITFLIDGEGYYTYNPAVKDATTWPFFEDQYILLNVAMGGAAGAIDPNFSESSMVVDYVRVYQNSVLNVGEITKDSFKIFPNPATDSIKIASEQRIDSIEIYTVLGNRVLEDVSFSNDAVDISSLNEGLYIIQIYSNDRKVVKKFIKN
jgi:beta-glucanase (GH16 family)